MSTHSKISILSLFAMASPSISIYSDQHCAKIQDFIEGREIAKNSLSKKKDCEYNYDEMYECHVVTNEINNKNLTMVEVVVNKNLFLMV